MRKGACSHYKRASRALDWQFQENVWGDRSHGPCVGAVLPKANRLVVVKARARCMQLARALKRRFFDKSPAAPSVMGHCASVPKTRPSQTDIDEPTILAEPAAGKPAQPARSTSADYEDSCKFNTIDITATSVDIQAAAQTGETLVLSHH